MPQTGVNECLHSPNLLSLSPHQPPPNTKTRLDDPTMRVPPLALELIDAIAGFVAEADRWNRSTLRAMSETCRAWLPIVRPHLYRRLTVEHKKISRLMDDLYNEDKHILSSCVREMSIYHRSGYGGDREDESYISILTLTKLLTKLPRLSSLELSLIPLKHFCPEGHAELCLGHASHLSLEYLSISFGCNSDDRFAHFIAVINLFAAIGSLKLEYPRWDEELYYTSSLRPLDSVRHVLHRLGTPLITAQISELIIVNDENPYADIAICETLRSSPSMKLLRVIDIETSQFEELISLFHLLDSGEDLLDLTFDVAGYIPLGAPYCI